MRSTTFDWLRLTGALMVICGHSFALLGRDAPTIFGEPIHIFGVKLFFAISGYLIAGSWQRDPDYPRFAEKRVRRIMPALLVVVTGTVFVLGPIVSTDAGYFRDPMTWRYLWRNAVLLPYHELPAVFRGNPIHAVNGCLWSLPWEVAMYAVTPLLVRAGPWACVVAAVGIAACHPDATLLLGVQRVAPWFLTGAAIQQWGWRVTTPTPPAPPVDISYGLYLIGFPVAQTLLALTPNLTPLALMLDTLAIAAPLAWLLRNCVEVPALDSHRRQPALS